MNLKLSEFFIYLIQKKSFYGRLASSLQRIVKPGLGTMAVGIRDCRAVMFFDPSFLDDLSLPAGLFALEHEMLHLVLDHIPRYLELLAVLPTDEMRRKAAAVYNIAMDCAINTMLRNHEGFVAIEEHLVKTAKGRALAEHAQAVADGKTTDPPPEIDESKLGMVLPEKYGLPLEGSFESYQWQLMQKVKLHQVTVSFGGNTHDFWTKGEADGQGQGQPGNGVPGKGLGKGAGNLDITFEGSSFGDMTSDELLSAAQRIREQVKETLRSVVRSIGGVGRGTLPGDMEEWLEEYLRLPIIPWWEIFATRARMSRASKFKRTAQQPNRALLALAEEDVAIIPSPGRMRDRSWRVFLMVDTSGSMSSESLEIIKSELFYMLSADEAMEIRYMQGDCTVHFDEVLRSGDAIPAQMLGRGGTDFDAYFAHMRQYVDDSLKAPDLVIVYTDGYAPAVSLDNRLPSDVPVLWLVTPQHSANFAEGYGEVIICDPEHNERRNK